MRRKDREIKEHNEIVEVIRNCDICRLGLVDGEYAYILPLNFGMEQDEEGKVTLYFHSALEGRKTELLKEGLKASFEMDTKHEIEYDEGRGYCTYYFESVMGRGTVHILNDDEKFEALKKLMDHYHPGANAYFNTAAIPRTLVYALEVEEMTGKRKLPK
ncbi:MAG: pyridoxamine 5'-phosphate oxidase family protein [Firmicutes bacterium]|jgi:nitroimidazol reductase NimA-like FMN-containing flavoprotein (pyridoxamine 5'-phosphate oxidase superfamily)|nr:pyridoxamine 5'-phosphate oxidase family protein [Bacillota bacterium]MBR3260520.1 pyridoxamine 5'-phosphate oxidase family protein [Bacillota bacterium]MBR3375897.1 pyridoxamine 5'-phosphate oxidase family protein [Bacillota bacterium]MBR4025156.1 pyridoxamine 5'-phosphate oxidase family protein [Bacillota bacterium]MBR6956003.1 pyridoxamine 5'-phosphate oxidase family protein [Bacillota bacterium]